MLPKLRLDVPALLVVSAFLLTASADAQFRFMENGNPTNRGSDPGFLPDTPTREKIDLAGVWNYSIEGGPSGTVRVPSAYDFTGRVSFERTFEVTAEMLEQYEFHFVMLGTNYGSEVTINGDFITGHLGGYTSVVQMIPGNTLQPGKENVVKIVVSNELDAKKTLPLKPQLWSPRNYGGILRDVYLLATPKLYIAGVVAHTTMGNNAATVSVDVTVDGALNEPAQEPGARKQWAPGVYVEMFDKITGFPAGKSSVAPLVREGDEWKVANAEVLIQNPKLWSPDSPELYLVKTFLVRTSGKEIELIDEFDLNYGLRDLKISNANILLNGKRIVLKGVIWQEDHPTWGSSLTYEEMEKDVVLIKNLGANTIRFGNHPPHPYMINLCDRYGLFAMEELPVAYAPSAILGEDYYVDLASARLTEMIVRDRHHASVLAWGLGDEFQVTTPEARRFVETLVRQAKALDARPLYIGTRMLENDVCTELVDFAALNVHGEDLKGFRKQLEDWKTLHPEQPVIVARFGTEVQQGNRNGYSDPLSYEAQARFYIQRFDVTKSLDYDGAIVWSFNDWRGDRPSLIVNSGDPWLHTLGLVSDQREKRLAYDAVRAVFRNERFVALPIGSHTASAPIVYVLSGLVVLIGLAYFYNASRRFRENLNRSVLNSYNFLADVRDQRIVPVLHSTLLGLVVSIALAIVTSSILYHFRDNWVLDNLLSYAFPADRLKGQVIELIRNPLSFIPVMAALNFLVLLLVSGLVLLLSPLFRARAYPFHAYAITMWATPPLLILVPVGMILYRIMESSLYILPTFVLLGVLTLWVILRLLKGISIIFDAYFVKVYLFGLASVVGVVFLVYFYLDYTQSTSVYLTYMFSMLSNSR